MPISADNRPLKQTLNQTTSEIEKESRKWDAAIDSSSDNMQKSFTRALDINRLKDWGIQAAKAITQFGLDCVNAASDLQEVQNVVDVTFGNSAAEIDAWAKTAITQFGLSETKAKQFASTLGAMMKSAGMAGDEVVKISEDLSGLAADMSSFYNLDFDTAFQKIRSGLAGETEPLKQLGINMSQANLEAFALEKGITKALDKMSQGEMVMLRYQYLMQATADAQGDFARTSDGYANSLRLLESNLDSIKTKIGAGFIDILANATSSLNNFLGSLTQQKPHTILDEFADIDLKTDNKIKEIQKTADNASDLVSTLEGISSKVINYQSNGNLVTFIESLSTNVSGLDSALFKAEQGNLNGAIDELAKHLAQDLGGDPEKWKNLLQAIGNNAGLAIEATKGNTGKTKEFLEQVAAGANDLTTDYSTYWRNLLGVLGDNALNAITALANGTNTGNIIAKIAGGANELKDGTSAKWSAFAQALGILDDKGNVPTNLQGVADALATNLGGDASKWETMLQAIGNNLGSVTSAVGTDGTKTAVWLTKAAEAADDLGGDYSENWKKLLVVYGDKAGAAISALATTNDPGSVLSGMATGANKLLSSSPGVWNSLLGALTQVNGLSNIFNNTNAGTNVENLAKALSGNSPDTTKAEAWKTFLSALSENPEALTTLTKTNAEDTAAWLETMADAVNKIDPTDANAWSGLFAHFVQGLPGLNDTEGGHAFFQSIAQEFLAMGNQSEAAREGLSALGLSTDQIDFAQKEWLETCKQLVQTIPSLSGIINTETGEVTDGTDAIREHIAEWKKAQDEKIYWSAFYEKKAAVLADTSVLDADLKVIQAEGRLKRLQQQSDAWEKERDQKSKQWVQEWEAEKKRIEAETENLLASTEYSEHIAKNNPYADQKNPYAEKLAEAGAAAEKAHNYRTKVVNDYGEAIDEVNDMEAGLIDMFGEESKERYNANQQVEKGKNVLKALTDEQKNAIEETEKAIKALKDYTDQVYSQSLRSIEGTLGGFGEVYDSIEAAYKNVDKLKKEWLDFKNSDKEDKDGSKAHELEMIWRNAENAIPSIQNLNAALDTQIKFLTDYYANLHKLRELGYSEDVIAMVSGGTTQDAGYARALANTTANDPQIKQMNEKVATIKKKSKEVASEMTENALTVDEKYQALAQSAADAIAKLNLHDDAKTNVTNTMQGIIEGLDETQATVKAQVESILRMLAELSGASYTVPGFNFNTGTFNGTQTIQVHSYLNVDGKRMANAVSQLQGDSMRTAQRSGGNP